MVTEKRGRKKVAPDLKKITVQLYIQRNIIDSFGGLEELQTILVKHTIKLHEKRIRDNKI